MASTVMDNDYIKYEQRERHKEYKTTLGPKSPKKKKWIDISNLADKLGSFFQQRNTRVDFSA